MAWAAIILSVILAGAGAELTGGQRTMLADVADRTANFDQAGLYALLQSAQESDTSGDGGRGDAKSPDYADLRERPDAWRGELCLVEGRLRSVWDFGRLSRPGWEHVRAVTLESDTGEVVIVFLTNPPGLTPGQRDVAHMIPAEASSQVALAGHFYMLLATRTQGGEPAEFPVFVGHSASIAAIAVPASRVESDSFFIVLLVIPAACAYVLLRIMLRRRRSQVRAARRLEDRRTDLPDDPAEALDVLAAERDASADEQPGPRSGPAMHDAESDEDATNHGDRQR